MIKFTEDRLEQAIIELLQNEGYEHVSGQDIPRDPTAVLIYSPVGDVFGF